MKKHILFTIFFFSFFLFSFGQKEANMWYFGEYAALDFNSGPPVPVPFINRSQMRSWEGCASIADKNTGQLLFYTDGTDVWDSTNTIMPNGSGLGGCFSSTQSAVIVPLPGSNTIYYVFTVDAELGRYTGNNGRLNYNIVDMTKNGGLGDVTVLNQQLMDSMTEKIAAVRNCKGDEIWVIAHQWNTDAFYAYLLTGSGLSAPVISHSGIVHAHADTSVMIGEDVGYMKCSPDGKKLALVCLTRLNTLQIFDFDNSTGVVSNPVTDTDFPDSSSLDGPYGLSFSPDNSKLYVTVLNYTSYFNQVYQYDMLAGSGPAIIASKTLVGSIIGVAGALQIGPDRKIYISKHASTLDVIDSPDIKGSGCKYVVDGASVFPFNSSFGLPDMVESYLAPYTANLTYTDCLGMHNLPFTNYKINGTVSISWNFGDPGSGVEDTSTLKNPIHVYNSTGNHTVTLILNNGCRTDTLKQVVNTTGINPTAGPDTAICEGDNIQLLATGGDTYKWSPTMGLNDSTIANPIAFPPATTTYTVTVSKPGCGSITATATIVVYPAPPTPNIVQLHDTLVSSVDSSYSSYQWYFNSALIPGATGAFYVGSQTGNYNLAVTDTNGCSISVGINIIINGFEFSSLAMNDGFAILPDPAGDEILISFPGSMKELTFCIYNILGQRISSGFITNKERKIKVRNLAKGIFFIQATGEKMKWTGKFIKE